MGSTADYIPGDGFRTFEVPGLVSDQFSTSTSMREDLLLLSWLIVLLRTREDGQASFEWAYDGENGAQHAEAHLLASRSMSTNQVMPNLQSKVGDVASAITRQIETRPCKDLSVQGLVLSTGTLSRTSEGAMDEVSC